MSITHTKTTEVTFPMECVENDCEHGGEDLANCPSLTLDICKECSDRNWEENEGCVVLWVGHGDHLDDLVLDEFEL